MCVCKMWGWDEAALSPERDEVGLRVQDLEGLLQHTAAACCLLWYQSGIHHYLMFIFARVREQKY